MENEEASDGEVSEDGEISEREVCDGGILNGSESEIQKIIPACLMFARLETIFRAGAGNMGWSGKTVKEIIAGITQPPEDDHVVEELSQIADVFMNVFINTGLVKESSEVVFNPAFGTFGSFCGGADADIFIDGVLYDFKSTKYIGYHWDQAAQLMGYYFLSRLCNFRQEGDLAEHRVKYLAIYFSRYGAICKVPAPELTPEDITDFGFVAYVAGKIRGYIQRSQEDE